MTPHEIGLHCATVNLVRSAVAFGTSVTFDKNHTREKRGQITSPRPTGDVALAKCPCDVGSNLVNPLPRRSSDGIAWISTPLGESSGC